MASRSDCRHGGGRTDDIQALRAKLEYNRII
jgi:hypothetical protein